MAAKNAKKTSKKVARKTSTKEQTSCICGCGEKTWKRFAPGHDARVKGWGIRRKAGERRDDDPKTLTKAQTDYLHEARIL